MLRFVDHLVYSTPDLDEGIHFIEQRFGANVFPGGRHENWGTRNALVSLGETTYLEIIGPNSERSNRQTPRLFSIDRIDRPCLVTWAAKGSNLTDIAIAARSAGIDLGSVSHGSRLLPDGNVLSWQLTDPYADRMDGILPFFIDWGDTAHPLAALPAECALLAVNLEHPHAQRAELAMKAVGITTHVATADAAAIRATIRTPNGIIELS